MPTRVLIRFTDGNHARAYLARAFDPSVGCLEVLAGPGEPPLS